MGDNSVNSGMVRSFGFYSNVVPTDGEHMSPNQALQVFFRPLDVVLVNEVDLCGPRSVSQSGLIKQPKHVGGSLCALCSWDF